jgi:uncharacterized protein (TIGR02996 family)
MTDEEGLLAAIVGTPGDDLPRLAYADWLEEHGQSERAELIRVQLELARLPPGDGRGPALRRREQQLLEAHAAEWAPPLPAWASRPEYRRGLVGQVTARAADFLAGAEELMRRVPLEGARLTEVRDPAALAASAHLAHLSSLDLSYNEIGAEGAAALAASPHLAHLASLALTCNEIGPEGAAALVASPHLARLSSLELGSNSIGPAGAAALAASPHLAHLDSLSLGGNRIGAAGAAALAASPHLARLTGLYLGDNEIGAAGARALAASPHLARLTQLFLIDNGIGASAAQALEQRFGTAVLL